LKLEKKLSRIRRQIISHLMKGRVVVIFGGPGSGKTFIASRLMNSRKFRSYFSPMIDMDHVEVYRDYLRRGGWGTRGRFYFVDSYDTLKPNITVPSLLIAQTLPSLHEVKGMEVVVLTAPMNDDERYNPLDTGEKKLLPLIVRVRKLPPLP
jgi:ABC-type glutathione transport system ATPase component